LGKNHGWKRKEPIQEKRWTNAGRPKAAFSVDEGSLGCKKASIGRYQIALETLLIVETANDAARCNQRFLLRFTGFVCESIIAASI
jgi:hypothetical protein